MPRPSVCRCAPIGRMRGKQTRTHDRVDLDRVLHRAHATDLDRRHVEDVNTSHVAEQLVTLDTGGLLVVGRDLSRRNREAGVVREGAGAERERRGVRVPYA